MYPIELYYPAQSLSLFELTSILWEEALGIKAVIIVQLATFF